MRIENIEALVWDLDGTLIDSLGIFEKILADVVYEHRRPMPDRELLLQNYHGSLEDTLKTVLGLSSDQELAKVLKSFLKTQESHYDGDLNAHLFEDAAALTQQAAKQGLHQLLLTNRAHANRGNASPRAIVAATVLADCIHEVRPGDEVDYRKPDKRSVIDWLEKHDITPDHLLVIGDQFVDAQLAMNLGARALLANRTGEIPHLDNLGDYAQKVIIAPNLHGIELN